MIPSEEVAYRAEVGPLITRNDFLQNSLSRRAADLQKRYQIRYERGQVTCRDSDTADRLWQAGQELLAGAGVYCVSSRRVIEFTAGEIAEALAETPDQVSLGAGAEVLSLTARRGHESGPPVVFSGPFNASVDDKSFLTINEACARERLIDVLHLPGFISSYRGVEPRPESGLAVEMAAFYGEKAREAVTRAGRPGMPIAGHVYAGLGDIAATDDERGLTRAHLRVLVMQPELIVDDALLSRLSYFRRRGIPVALAFTPFIGGYAGDPAGTAIVAVASVQAAAVLGCAVPHFGAQHSVYLHQTSPQSIWMSGLVTWAASRNGRAPFVVTQTTAAGPGTLQFIYEFSALLVASATAGGHVAGPRPAQPQRPNQVSPLMCRLFAQVAHAAAGIERQRAEDIARSLMDRYGSFVGPHQAPTGLSFDEMYDLKTNLPRNDHRALYLEARTALRAMGVPLAPDE